MGLLDLFGHKYPFTDFHELNLDWCITAVLQLQKAFKDFSAGNKIVFANPLQHDLTKTYAKNTIVIGSNGNAYMSLQSVPVGVTLTDTDYWLMVFDFEDYTERANKNFTNHYFSNTDRTTIPLAVGDWLVLDDVLYKVIVALNTDDLFIIGTNITHFTVEQFIKDFITTVNQTLNQFSLTIQQYKNDIDASELAYRQQLAQDIANTTAALTAQFNQVISAVTVDSEVIDARIAWDGATYSTLGEAIRHQFNDLIGSVCEVTDNMLLESWDVGYITASGTIATSTPSIHNAAYTAIEASTNYFIRHPEDYTMTQVCWYDSSFNFISRTAPVSDIATSPATAAYLRLSLYGYGTVYNHDMGVYAIGDDNEYIPHIIAKDPVARKNVTNAYNTLDNKIDGVISDIADFEHELRKFMFDQNINNTDISQITGSQTFNDYNCTATSTQLNLVQFSGLDSYALVLQDDCKLVCGDKSDLTYYCLAILESPSGTWTPSGDNYYMTGDSAARYRLSDDNLPTIDNPLDVVAGTMIVITVPSGVKPYINIWNDTPKTTNKVINTDIIDVEMFNDYFYYYIQSADNNFLRFKFEHFVDADSNADAWVQRIVDLVGPDKRTLVKHVIREGEWEMAVKLQGRSDYIGGKNHGSEVTTSMNLFFDGVPYETLNQDFFSCKEIIVTSISNMYDPNDETTLVGMHYKKYIINAEKMIIKQHIKWVVTDTASESYALMLPAIRGNDIYSNEQITDTFYDDLTLTEYDVSTTLFNPYVTAKNDKGNTLTLYGKDSGVYMTAKCSIKGKDIPFSYVSNSSYYNKIYMAYCGNNTPVASGDLWEWVSEYQITAN